MTGFGRRAAAACTWIAATVILAVTLLPMWDTNQWWVRVMEFPRLEIAIGAALTLLVAAVVLRGPSRWIIPVLMIAASGYQVWRIYPYTPFAEPEMTAAADHPNAIKVLSANVLMENDRHDLVLDAIAEHEPDILLLMETDQTWIDALAPALERYSTVLRAPKDNHYGIVFATRLEADTARIVHLTEGDTPSVFAQLVGPGGTVFRFVGLHPRPPLPGQSTVERDAQIFYAARFARASGIPLIAMGDFNDVAWSDTSQMFKHVGRYIDPRIGRGFFASFDAKTFYIRFPIDQLYVSEDVVLVSLERGDFIGSDHFPMIATLRLDADLAARLNVSPPPLSDDELEDLRASVAQSRRRLGHTDVMPE